jgi:hypothetical protein
LNKSIKAIFVSYLQNECAIILLVVGMTNFVNIWEAEDLYRKNKATGKPLKHEIRERANGQFIVVSQSAFGTQSTYGPYDSLADAKLFLLRYNYVPKDAWKAVKVAGNAVV